MFSMMTIILGRTEAEAKAKYADYRRHIAPEGALALMSGWTGVDFSTYDLDAPLRDSPVSTLRWIRAVRPATARRRRPRRAPSAPRPTGRRRRRARRRSRCRARAARTARGRSGRPLAAPWPRRAGRRRARSPRPDGRAGAGHQAVTVAVGLDDRHHLGRSACPSQRGDVVADRVQVDDGACGRPPARARAGVGVGSGRLCRSSAPVSGSARPARQEPRHDHRYGVRHTQRAHGSAGVGASPATPCTSAATLPASSGDSPAASSAPASPASTSPDAGGRQPRRAVRLERTSPAAPGSTTSVVAPLSSTVAPVSSAAGGRGGAAGASTSARSTSAGRGG